MEEQKRRFDGVWIPAEIWLSETLSLIDKIVLTEINSLDNEETGCYASNQYLAKFCQCSERKITDSITKLKKMGLIEQISFNGRTRILKIVRQSSKNCYAESQILLGEIYNIDYNINNKENILKESSENQKQCNYSNSNLTSSTMVDIESVGPSSKTNALTREKLSIIDTSRAFENKPSCTNKLSVDSGKEKEDKILDIYNYWNSLGKPTHTKLTDTFVKAIKKALKTYSSEEIKKAILNYKTVLNDKEYYFDYIWGLDTFLKQSNCLPHFVDSGEKWLNYCKKKGIVNKQKVEVKIDENGVISI